MRIEPDSEGSLGDLGFDLDELARAMVERWLYTALSRRQLARLLDARWLRAETSRPIGLNLSVNAALRRASSVWLEVLYRANNLPRQRVDRRAKRLFLVELLKDPAWLRACVGTLSGGAQLALRRILDNGGWMRLADLSHQLGAFRKRPFSADQPVQSLGELCLRGLIFLGRAHTRAYPPHQPRQADVVAVVPKDLRARLRHSLEHPLSSEEEEWLMEALADPSERLEDALVALEAYFDLSESPHVISKQAARDFLVLMSREGHAPTQIWGLVHVFLSFVDRQRHEIRHANDLCGYHLSEMATQFLDDMFSGRHTLGERRKLIYVVRRLYQHLHRLGEVTRETAREIDAAAERLLSAQHRIPTIHRPPPLGGEVLLERLNPFTLHTEQVRHNHLRIALVWSSAFHSDWELMQAACPLVVDGARKAELIAEVMALDPPTQEWLIAQGDAEDYERALAWFQDERVLDLSAW